MTESSDKYRRNDALLDRLFADEPNTKRTPSTTHSWT